MLLFGGNTAAASSGETSGQYCDKSRTNKWSITQRQANGKKTQWTIIFPSSLSYQEWIGSTLCGFNEPDSIITVHFSSGVMWTNLLMILAAACQTNSQFKETLLQVVFVKIQGNGSHKYFDPRNKNMKCILKLQTCDRRTDQMRYCVRTWVAASCGVWWAWCSESWGSRSWWLQK